MIDDIETVEDILKIEKEERIVQKKEVVEEKNSVKGLGIFCINLSVLMILIVN